MSSYRCPNCKRKYEGKLDADRNCDACGSVIPKPSILGTPSSASINGFWAFMGSVLIGTAVIGLTSSKVIGGVVGLIVFVSAFFLLNKYRR